MTIIWIKSRKWKRGDLDGQTVEFDITYSDARRKGVGQLLVRGDGVQKMAIDIDVPHPKEYFSTLYHLTDSLVENIEVHPDQSVARYRVVGRFGPST